MEEEDRNERIVHIFQNDRNYQVKIHKLDVKDSVDEALLDNLFDRSSYLYEEPGNLLKQELEKLISLANLQTTLT